MKIFLTILMLAVFAADAAVLLQLRKRFKSWENQLDEPLSDEEQRYVETRLKLLGVLSAAGTMLFFIVCILYDLLPLFGG